MTDRNHTQAQTDAEIIANAMAEIRKWAKEKTDTDIFWTTEWKDIQEALGRLRTPAQEPRAWELSADGLFQVFTMSDGSKRHAPAPSAPPLAVQGGITEGERGALDMWDSLPDRFSLGETEYALRLAAIFHAALRRLSPATTATGARETVGVELRSALQWARGIQPQDWQIPKSKDEHYENDSRALRVLADAVAAPSHPRGEGVVELEPEIWECQQCGKQFDRETFSHGVADHHPSCDGNCRGSCPVERECGPVNLVPPPSGQGKTDGGE